MADAVRALRPGPRASLFHGGSLVQVQGQVGTSGLLDGGVLSVGQPVAAGGGAGPMELAVVGGPLSGRAWRIRSEAVTVGRSAQAGVCLDHPPVSREHFRLVEADGAWRAEDLGSTNGTWADGRRISVIEAGACLLQVRAPRTGDADLQPDGAGALAFNRPARIRPAPPQGEHCLSGPAG